nr:MAG TPA: Lysis protein [Caudoviricetes sp.]
MKKIIWLLLFCFTLTGCTSGNKVSTEKLSIV